MPDTNAFNKSLACKTKYLSFSSVPMYRLLVECFTKYCVVREAIRHFRALRNFEGGTKVLHNEGNFGDPLSLYLRALCRDGMPINDTLVCFN